MSLLTAEDATAKIETHLPGWHIQVGPVEYENLWLFSVFSDDPSEGQLDPFYSVDRVTGVFSGFSILEDPETFLKLLSRPIYHSEFLAHYGVKGMKWGVRKADSKSSGRSSTKATSAKLEAGLNVVKPFLGMTVPRANLTSHAVQLAYTAIEKSGKIPLSAVKSSFLSPLAIAGYAVSTVDSGAYRIPGMSVKNAIRGGWPRKPDLAKRDMSLSDIQTKVVKQVNPDFPGLGTTNNCLRATYTYEMRRRGFDVSATKTILATGQARVGQTVMVGKLGRTKQRIRSSRKSGLGDRITGRNKATATDVFKALASQPDRSRGELQMSWGRFLGGHSVAYEIVNGKPVIIDAQSGKTYSTAQELNRLTRRANGFNYTRLDNMDLNQFALPAWIKDAEG